MSNENGAVNGTNKVPHDESDIGYRARMERALRVKAVRDSSGLSLVDFAAEMGVSKQTQLQYERGNTSPDCEYLDNLYFKFAVDLGPLITGAPRAKAIKVTEDVQRFLDRYAALPPKVRKTVDDVLLLAWLAYQDRAAYHAQEAAPTPAPKKPKRGE